MNFNVEIFPLYGLAIGFNFYSTDMEDLEVEQPYKLYQLMFLFFGVSIIVPIADSEE
jgi:hypothetical protein